MGRIPRGSFASRPSRFRPGALGREDEPPRAGKSSRRRPEFGPDGLDEGLPESGRAGRPEESAEPGRDDPGREEGRPLDGRPLDGRPLDGRPLDDPPDEERPLDGRPELLGRSEFPRRSSMCLFSYLY